MEWITKREYMTWEVARISVEHNTALDWIVALEQETRLKQPRQSETRGILSKSKNLKEAIEKMIYEKAEGRLDFLARLKGKRIICYGASLDEEGFRVLSELKDFIICFVDVDERRHGLINLAGRNLAVFNTNILKFENWKNSILVITCKRYHGIMDELEKIDGLKTAVCYALADAVQSKAGSEYEG
jgi:hypothetical protein